MAMVTCPECKREVSSQATACPHCGAPRRPVPLPAKSTNPWMVIGWIILAVVLLPIAGCIVAMIFGVSGSQYQEYLDKVEATKTSQPAVPAPAAPIMEITIESFRCEQRGDDTRAEITVRNSGPGAITLPKVFFDFDGKQEDALFDPVTIPAGSRATAFARHNGLANCVVVSAQDIDGRIINIRNEEGP
jgi:phosphate/sulfate permease